MRRFVEFSLDWSSKLTSVYETSRQRTQLELFEILGRDRNRWRELVKIYLNREEACREFDFIIKLSFAPRVVI